MKRRGIVTDVEDPRSLGRIRVKLIGFDQAGDSTPWCWPCSPFAGPGYGFCYLPVPSNEVYVEQTDEGDWVWTGFCWTTDRNPRPTDATKNVRLIQTPTGHRIKLDEDGDIEISHGNGAFLTLKPNGDIELNGSSDNVIRYSLMKIAFDSFIATFNSHTHTVTAAPGVTTAPLAPATADMTSSKVDEVKVS